MLNISLEQIVAFVSNNFEFLILLNFSIAGFLLILMLAVKYTEYVSPRPRLFIHTALAFFVVIGQLLMIMMSGYIYWVNYKKENVIDFDRRVMRSTDWVREKIKIYFIAAKDLAVINADGTGKEYVFEGADNVLSYHFSPDGEYLAVVTETQLYKLRLKDRVKELIDSVSSETSGEFSGVIRAVSWSPDSSKFCYHIARWSKFSSLDNYYLVNAQDNTKQLIKKPNRKIDFLYWSAAGDSLYYFYTEAKDTSFHGYAYDLRLYRIDLKDLESQLVLTVPAKSPEDFRPSLEARDVRLFWKTEQLSFLREGGRESIWESPAGARLGIDDSDHLYLVKGRLWRKRLFKIPRVPLPGGLSRYQYQGGMLAVSSLRWLPSGQYAVMGHEALGVLILDPFSGKMGQLAAARGNTFGWYEGSEKSKVKSEK